MDKGIIRIIEEKGARSDVHDRGDGIRVRKTLRPVRQRHSGVPFHRPEAGAELYGKEYVKRTLQKEGATMSRPPFFHAGGRNETRRPPGRSP